MGNEHRSGEYLPLASSTDEEGRRTAERPTQHWSWASKLVLFVCIFEAFVIIALVVDRHYGRTMHTGQAFTENGVYYEPAALFSPAHEALEHEVKTFTVGKKDRTVYQGTSSEVDDAWIRLYNQTIFKVPKAQAAMLPNRTWPLLDEPGYYIATLDVFHQLHCLNNVRMALTTEAYKSGHGVEHDHISHCIDSIRQSLMCSADVSVNVWQWDESYKDDVKLVGRSNIAHSCRNYDRLLEWAQERAIENMPDGTVKVQDDLKWPHGDW